MTLEDKDDMINFIKHIRSMLPNNSKDIDNMSEEDIQLIYDECHADINEQYHIVDRDYFIILKDLDTMLNINKDKHRMVSKYLAVYPASYAELTRLLYPDAEENVINYKRNWVHTVISEEAKKYYWLDNMVKRQGDLYYK